MSTLDTGIIIAYLVMLIVLGLYANRQQQNVEDYYVAGGRVGTISIICLWLAGWIGGAAIVGTSTNTFKFGVSAGWYFVGTALGCFLFGLFFAARVKREGAKHGYLTYPDMIEGRFGSRTRIVATVTTIAAYIAYSAGQISASAFVLQTLLELDFNVALMLSAGIIVLYTATGGFLAVTYTDWVQVAILFVGVAIIGIPVAIASGGTWSAISTSLPPEFFTAGNWGWPTIIALLVSIPLSFFTAMDNYTRCYAAKSEAVIRRGTLIASALLIPILIGTVWLGMTSRLLLPETTDAGTALTQFVMTYFPIGLKGLLLVGILAALMSTADICILTASANATRDIYQRYINPDISPQKMLRISMLASAAIGIGATLMASFMKDVVDILLVAFTINAATLFVPSVAMIYARTVSKSAAFWSIASAFAVVVGWYALVELTDVVLPTADPLWPGLLVSFGVFMIMSKLDKNKA